MKIVWVSRHKMTRENCDILRRAFSEFEVVQYSNTVKNVKELIEFANREGADVYIVVLPPHIVQQLLSKDKRPVYRFIVEREVDETGNVKVIPVGLERIVRIEIITEKVI